MPEAKTKKIPSRPPGKAASFRPRDLAYFAYRHGLGMNHFIRRRVRPAAIGLMIVVVITAGAAAGNADAPVFQVFALACSLLGVGWVFMVLRRAKVTGERLLPAYATVGHKLSYHVKLHPHKGKSLKRFQLLETPPDPRPSRRIFHASREPGEEKRNFFDRALAWYRWNWLCETRSLYEGGESVLIDKLKPGAHSSVTVTLEPRRRGLIRLNDLRLMLPDPLGLFQRCVKVAAPAAVVAVLPRRYPLPRFELPGSARFQPGGEATSRHSGSSGEFTGLRDYEAGDPLRLIHWPTWARTGKPVVKELEDTFFPRHGLILDTFPAAEDEALFEDAVSVAASFIVAVDASESLIDLMFIAGHERVITAGQGMARAETLLEVLAGVESSEEEDYDSLAKLVMRYGDDLAGCLCVFAGWSAVRARLLQRLQQAGIAVSALVVCREKPAAMPHCHFVRSSELAGDLMKLPMNL